MRSDGRLTDYAPILANRANPCPSAYLSVRRFCRRDRETTEAKRDKNASSLIPNEGLILKLPMQVQETRDWIITTDKVFHS